jgi:hypothetical protein
MTDLQRLLSPLRRRQGRMLLAAVPLGEWDSVALALELARAEYAAFPVGINGWLVLTTARLREHHLGDVTGVWETLASELTAAHGTAGIRLSPGWSAQVCLASEPGG